MTAGSPSARSAAPAARARRRGRRDSDGTGDADQRRAIDVRTSRLPAVLVHLAVPVHFAVLVPLAVPVPLAAGRGVRLYPRPVARGRRPGRARSLCLPHTGPRTAASGGRLAARLAVPSIISMPPARSRIVGASPDGRAGPGGDVTLGFVPAPTLAALAAAAGGRACSGPRFAPLAGTAPLAQAPSLAAMAPFTGART